MKFLKTAGVFITIIALLTLSNIFRIEADAQESSVNVYLIYSYSCPHCHDEIEFLDDLSAQNSLVNVLDFEVSEPETAYLAKNINQHLGISTQSVPITIIGLDVIPGYSDETHQEYIEERVEYYISSGDPDIIGKMIEVGAAERILSEEDVLAALGEYAGNKVLADSETSVNDDDQFSNAPSLNLPVIGTIKTSSLSLPVLTVVLGLVDGFNPCAMWTLLFLISLLLGMKDRKRMWILGISFIVASAAVYFLFMVAWLNLFLFLGFIAAVRITIGLIAGGAGTYQLWDYFKNTELGCKITGNEKRRKIFEKLKLIAHNPNLLVAVAGIILLAFAVNLVELICSAGLPAIFTQVLALNNLSFLQYYGYILLYILFFMIDDLFVFFAAMTTLHAVGIESRYGRYSKLIGGIVMLAIGILLIFKPEVLMFG